jgi:hypothetical protein
VKVYVLMLWQFEEGKIEGVYASLEAADRAETAYNRKHPFDNWTPIIDGPFTLRGVKR